MRDKKTIARKARRIKMLLLDVDGVMTDGGLYYSARGVEMKRFHAQDGYGVVRAHDHGLKIGIISGRSTPIVDARARDLKVEELHQGSNDKVTVMQAIRARHKLKPEEIAFIGDELFDVPLLQSVGLSLAPKNARPEVKRRVDYVTQARGGEGAVREAVDLILQHQKKVKLRRG
jgi:YrbI family 3-deoxy-D-manno-octulosonate 8-phosphate phosphatase